MQINGRYFRIKLNQFESRDPFWITIALFSVQNALI